MALPASLTMSPFREEQDQAGYTHVKYNLYLNGYRLDKIVLALHLRAGNVVSWNTNFAGFTQKDAPALSRDAARDIAIAHMASTLFRWEQPGEDQLLREQTGNPAATWFPAGEMVYGLNFTGTAPGFMRLCWKFDVYSIRPLSRQEVYVDAANGEIIFTNERITETDVPAVANTYYSGVQDITCDSISPTSFRLVESGRGGGIETKNMQGGTNHSGSVHFTDTDGYWDNVTPEHDEAATDVHWAAEATYDMYMSLFGRNSYDGVGGKLRMYVHYDVNYSNAFWDGSSANFGDGPGSASPFGSLDVTGHEISHGLTQETCGLIYSYESGALNESFSDVFGAAIEFLADPANSDWLMAEDLPVGPFRSMIAPNAYNNPDTYLGNFWYSGSGDNGGVHTNSGVQNKWYQLLTDGGSGSNDNGDAYNVTGLGLAKATAIAYRSLNVYLSPTSDYADARFYSIRAAQDLYGDCAPEVEQTMNAWYAVGVGLPWSVAVNADFIATDTIHCANPAVVAFTNKSTGGFSYAWTFGDGGSSTLENPTHTYTFPGNYDVRLISTGCAAVKDTLYWPALVKIDAMYPCVVNMTPQSENTVYNACGGVLRDAGGGENYPDNNLSQVTIAPLGALTVQLNFHFFEYATSGDYVAIYDGPNTSSPSFGLFNGTALPLGGVITSSGPSITIFEKSNFFGTFAGFELDWSCTVNRDDQALDGAFSLFPNPATDEVNLTYSFTGQRTVDVTVTDVTGQVIWQSSDTAGGRYTKSISTTSWASGVYFVRVRDGNHSQVHKVVVQ